MHKVEPKLEITSASNSVMLESGLLGGERSASEVQSLPTALEVAILETILYFDVFSYPITPAEIHRFLNIQTQEISPAQVKQALQTSGYLQTALEQSGSYVFVKGRAEIIARRVEREISSRKSWQTAQPFLNCLRAVPFLRTALVTGSLALDNAPANDDIDLLLITAPGRLWLCRAGVILIVRLARLRQVILCPNYLITSEGLELSERNLYTAHEMVQMRFLFGKPTYLGLLAKNRWAAEFLPNALPLLDGSTLADYPTAWTVKIQQIGERLLSGRVGQWFENWEQQRKTARFTRMGGDETNFSADVCKGHHNGHGGRTLQALDERKKAFPWLDQG